MLNGLDLFSGIGGLTLGLKEWVLPRYYCEFDRYVQGVLLSRMSEGSLPYAPIWDDVSTLRGEMLEAKIDIICGGFPCQDISVAGAGKGLAGERSGLFFEIVRLIKDLGPKFIFLENVPGITTNGGVRVVSELAAIGYDCRWTMVSAAEVGAWHIRKRWFLLAHRDSDRGGIQQESRGKQQKTPHTNDYGEAGRMADDNSKLPQSRGESEHKDSRPTFESSQSEWAIEPDVDRVVHGLPCRVDRIKGLGNAVVPIQAREAFKRLMGL